MGKLVEAAKANHLLDHLPAQGVVALGEYAKNLDTMCGGGKNAYAGSVQSSAPAATPHKPATPTAQPQAAAASIFTPDGSGSIPVFNKQLTSLLGAPQTVVGNFDCSFNKLTSLQGAPASVGGSFNCRANNLTSLQGAPSKVGGRLYILGVGNSKVTAQDVADYEAYLKNPDAAHTDKTGHYAPYGVDAQGNAYTSPQKGGQQ